MNPVVYFAMSSSFRASAKEMFLAGCPGHKAQEAHGVFSLASSLEAHKTQQSAANWIQDFVSATVIRTYDSLINMELI